MITIPMQVQVEGIIVPMDVGTDIENIGLSIGAEYNVAQAETYDGSYEVTPRVYAQSLDTDGKLMDDDVTVHEIPVTRTSNLQGGLTVLIG